MNARRGWGEDGAFFEHTVSRRDSERHRNCQGRWRVVRSSWLPEPCGGPPVTTQPAAGLT
jgi:hypothetical protein